MSKEQIINTFLDPKYIYDVTNSKQYKPKPIKKLGILDELRYGVEFEFPYDIKQEEELLYNFNLYNNQLLNNQWRFSKEVTTEYPPNICIGEFTSPILRDNDNLCSLDQLNVITQLVRAFEHKTIKASSRNMHFHFDMKLLGESLEYLVPYLQVFRAYENIIARTCSSETGRVPKKGISNTIQKALNEENVSDILRVYNGGDYNADTLYKYRQLSLNLFNMGAYYEAKSTIPGLVSTKCGNEVLEAMNTKLMLDCESYDKNSQYIRKKLAPTFELRMSPTTHDLGYFQQYLLLHCTTIVMARNLKSIPMLEEKVQQRNDYINRFGPQVFDLDFDDGISDLLAILPQNLGSRLLLPYMYSKPISLYKTPLTR